MTGIVSTDRIEVGLAGDKFHWSKDSSGYLVLRSGPADVDTGTVLATASTAGGLTGNTPGFRVSGSSGTLPGDSTSYDINWATVEYNFGGMWTGSKFIPTVSGVYLVCGWLPIGEGASSHTNISFLAGSTRMLYSEVSTGTGLYIKELCGLVRLTAGTVCSLQAAVSSASGALASGYFAAHLLRQI